MPTRRRRPSASSPALLLVAATIVAAPRAQETPPPPPNLIVILTDDQGYHDVGFHGCTDIATPNLDRIAREGVHFPNGYVSYSVCGPSRAGLMTGRYQDRFGFTTNPTIDPSVAGNGLPLTERTLAEALRPRGYTSMAIGKWHLGTHPELRPLRRGFDEFFGFLSGGHDYLPERLTVPDLESVAKPYDWYRTRLLRDEQRVTIAGYLTEELSAAAVDFVTRSKDRPFFLYLAYNAPHTPLQATEKYLERCAHIAAPKRRKYAAMLTAVDDGVGDLLDALDRLALAERTLVFYLSDNGGPLATNGSDNTPLRGAKGSLFEGGIRVPFAARWPGTLPPGATFEPPVISLDIFATMARLAGIDDDPERPLDGVDLLPFLTGRATGRPHAQLHWRQEKTGLLAMRDGDQKRLVGPDTDLTFDLVADQAEAEDRTAEHREFAAAMLARMRTWAAPMLGQAFPPLGSWRPGTVGPALDDPGESR